MTIAICTVCGEEKFGAWVPCNKCGRTPTTIVDKAKSITLSDHNFPSVELRRFSQMLKAGLPISYDPIGLAISAGNILSHDYYWHHMGTGEDDMPCMRCGRRFQIDRDDEQELCDICRAEADQPIRFCPKCVTICDLGERFCPKCGSTISTSHSNSKSVAFSLMLGVERLADPSVPLKRFEGMEQAHAGLTSLERSKCLEEIRWLALYATSTILQENAHTDTSVGMYIYQVMIDLYSLSLVFREIEDRIRLEWVEECTERFEEYDRTLRDFVKDPGHDPNKWFLALAVAAEEYCYPDSESGIAVWQLVLDIGYFIKVQRDILTSALTRTR